MHAELVLGSPTSIWSDWFVLNAEVEQETTEEPGWSLDAFSPRKRNDSEDVGRSRHVLDAMTDASGWCTAWLAYSTTSEKVHDSVGWIRGLFLIPRPDRPRARARPSRTMAEPVENNLRYLAVQDIHAMVGCLRDVPGQAGGYFCLRVGSTPSPTPRFKIFPGGRAG